MISTERGQFDQSIPSAPEPFSIVELQLGDENHDKIVLLPEGFTTNSRRM